MGQAKRRTTKNSLKGLTGSLTLAAFVSELLKGTFDRESENVKISWKTAKSGDRT